MGNAVFVAAAAAWWVMQNNKPKQIAATKKEPNVGEQDFTGKVAQTGTIAVTKPKPLPDEHIKNGLQEKREREDHDLDMQRVQDTLALLAQQQTQPAEAITGSNGFNGELVPAACSYGEKCLMGVNELLQAPQLRQPCA